ncbi:MAG TPA: hypothetical protein VGF48_15470 [Thermoanaerobaculia bacterium]|jgi:hypothetical protein
MKSEWIEHAGHRIIYCDFRNFARDVDALRIEVTETDDEITRQPPMSVLALIDVRGTTTSLEAVDVFKRSAARSKGFIIRQAVVGVAGIQKILAQAVARFSSEELHLFDTVEAAKEWLVKGHDGGGTKVAPDV